MPIYMKVDGIDGPVTYDKTPGWIEVLSAVETVKGRGVVVAKHNDDASSFLFRDQLSGTRNVTIAWADYASRPKVGPPAGPLIEVARLKLTEAVIMHFAMSAGGDGKAGPVESFSWNGPVTWVKRGAAQSSRLVPAQDWAVKARVYLNRPAATP